MPILTLYSCSVYKCKLGPHWEKPVFTVQRKFLSKYSQSEEKSRMAIGSDSDQLTYFFFYKLLRHLSERLVRQDYNFAVHAGKYLPTCVAAKNRTEKVEMVLDCRL